MGAPPRREDGMEALPRTTLHETYPSFVWCSVRSTRRVRTVSYPRSSRVLMQHGGPSILCSFTEWVGESLFRTNICLETSRACSAAARMGESHCTCYSPRHGCPKGERWPRNGSPSTLANASIVNVYGRIGRWWSKSPSMRGGDGRCKYVIVVLDAFFAPN